MMMGRQRLNFSAAVSWTRGRMLENVALAREAGKKNVCGSPGLKRPGKKMFDQMLTGVGIKMKLSISAPNSHTSIIQQPLQNTHMCMHLLVFTTTGDQRRLFQALVSSDWEVRGPRFIISTSATTEPVFILPNS